MALTISSQCFSRERLSLAEAIGEIRLRVRENEPESLGDAAPFLYALGRDRTFLVHALAAQTPQTEIGPVGLQDTSLVLYHDSGLVIRANFWFPRHGFPAAHASRADSLGYLIPHNHDFDFLTLGYWGPGYHTSIYDCGMTRSTTVSPGDPVELVFLEDTALPEGKLMLYRALRDVHSQVHPSAFSVSLNVAILPSPDKLGQHLFDTATRSVRSVLDHSSSQILACRLAGLLGDERLIGHLHRVRTNSSDSRVTSAASAALEAIAKQS